MRKNQRPVSASTAPPLADATVAQMIDYGSDQFIRAELWFGHGSDNARDEAAELVIFGADLRHEEAPRIYEHKLSETQRERVLNLFDRRISERVPAAYLTHRMWFAGHEFYVDERVLVPRSPLAELIDRYFEPWIDASRIDAILDIGTGSGCIAIASALALPGVRVDAADISREALEVTTLNIERHRVGDRVRGVQSDVFDGLAGARYDVIVSNPPYVGTTELSELPDEYQREPSLGLYGGSDGLDIVRRILAQAAGHLHPGGILVVEVGNSEEALVNAYPRVPFTWLEFERGGGGVLLLTAEQLAAYRADFAGV